MIRELNIINIIPFTSTLVFLALFSLPLGAASDPLQTVTETITPSAVNWEQLGDRLKGLGIGKSATTDIGGQFRMRFHDENNIRNTAGVPNALGLTAADDSFLLYRTRLWFDTQVNENLSVYAELLDANSTLEQRSPRPIDENRLDLHQLYIDTTIQENWQARVGRQAFTLGAQRLVSSLDWANTRRVFDGVSVKRNGERFGVNLFWFQPITIDVSNSDHTNHAVNLYGAYVNAAVNEDRHLDLYWIALDNSGSGTKYDTLGGKLTGRGNNWDYEFEGGYQFGDNSDGSDHQAGFTSIGLGKDLTHKIGGSLWIYHDWASGDDTVGNGFHHYIPLAHKYLGFMDLYGRRNLHDFNMR
ncbi:MAG: alginate export family protein [Planctomycetaceae bacterium]|nr:alginate export family protein [Planctomycetaceae bacterium]